MILPEMNSDKQFISTKQYEMARLETSGPAPATTEMRGWQYSLS